MSKKPHYVNNKEFLQAISEWKEKVKEAEEAEREEAVKPIGAGESAEAEVGGVTMEIPPPPQLADAGGAARAWTVVGREGERAQSRGKGSWQRRRSKCRTSRINCVRRSMRRREVRRPVGRQTVMRTKAGAGPAAESCGNSTPCSSGRRRGSGGFWS